MIAFAMSIDEILSSYRTAADKNKQIGILAELNAVSKKDVIGLLTEHGAIAGMPKKSPAKPKQEWNDEMVDELRRLYHDGVPQIEIAERLGVDKTAINNKLNRSGIRKEKRPAVYSSPVDETYIKSLEETLTKLKAENDELKNRQSQEVTAPNSRVLDDTITYAEHIMCVLDVLKSVELKGLTELESLSNMLESVHNDAVALFDCLSELQLEFCKEASQ